MILSLCATRVSSRQSCRLKAVHIVSLNLLTPRRYFITTQLLAEKSEPSSKRVQIKRQSRAVSAATWLALNPAEVQPSDVLEELAKFDNHRTSPIHTAVVLATPSFTHWFDSGHDFLANLVQLVRDTSCMSALETPIRTISVIVDRIPSNSELLDRVGNFNVGHEGISVLYSSHPVRSRRVDSGSAADNVQKSHVRFVSRGQKRPDQIIALPVARTLFRNGLQSTFFEDIWEASGPNEVNTRFERKARSPLQSFNIDAGNLMTSHLQIPMEPLTVPEEVISSMGNVLKQLKRHSTGEIIPASTDLEVAVPRFLKSTWLSDASRNNLSVFALTAGKDFYTGASEDTVHGIWSPNRQRLMMNLLKGHARMHRVTGGGGGWGNKKGLLSLEPGVDILNEIGDQQPALPQLGEDYDFETSFAPVSPGDTVQFFAVFPGPQKDPADGAEERRRRKEKDPEAKLVKPNVSNRNFPQIAIGTNPPEEQYSASSQGLTPPGQKLSFIPDYFGMLSEAGSCLGFDEPGGASGQERVSFTSRLDIPYATFVYRSAPRHIQRPVVRRVLSQQKPKSFLL